MGDISLSSMAAAWWSRMTLHCLFARDLIHLIHRITKNRWSKKSFHGLKWWLFNTFQLSDLISFKSRLQGSMEFFFLKNSWRARWFTRETLKRWPCHEPTTPADCFRPRDWSIWSTVISHQLRIMTDTHPLDPGLSKGLLRIPPPADFQQKKLFRLVSVDVFFLHNLIDFTVIFWIPVCFSFWSVFPPWTSDRRPAPKACCFRGAPDSFEDLGSLGYGSPVHAQQPPGPFFNLVLPVLRRESRIQTETQRTGSYRLSFLDVTLAQEVDEFYLRCRCDRWRLALQRYEPGIFGGELRLPLGLMFQSCRFFHGDFAIGRIDCGIAELEKHRWNTCGTNGSNAFWYVTKSIPKLQATSGSDGRFPRINGYSSPCP